MQVRNLLLQPLTTRWQILSLSWKLLRAMMGSGSCMVAAHPSPMPYHSPLVSCTAFMQAPSLVGKRAVEGTCADGSSRKRGDSVCDAGQQAYQHLQTSRCRGLHGDGVSKRTVCPLNIRRCERKFLGTGACTGGNGLSVNFTPPIEHQQIRVI